MFMVCFIHTFWVLIYFISRKHFCFSFKVSFLYWRKIGSVPICKREDYRFDCDTKRYVIQEWTVIQMQEYWKTGRICLLHHMWFFFSMSVWEMPIGLIFWKKLFCTNRASKCASFVFWHNYIKLRGYLIVRMLEQ